MEKLYSIKDASDYIGVTSVTMRKWDKMGLLVPTKTKGGHRRYTESQLNKFKCERKFNYSYESLYRFLEKAYEISEHFNDENSDSIKEIRDRIGQKLLSQF